MHSMDLHTEAASNAAVRAVACELNQHESQETTLPRHSPWLSSTAQVSCSNLHSSVTACNTMQLRMTCCCSLGGLQRPLHPGCCSVDQINRAQASVSCLPPG